MIPGARLERLLSLLPDSPDRAAALVPALGGAEALAEEARTFGLRELLSHYLPDVFPPRHEDVLAAKFRAKVIERTTVEVHRLLGGAGVGSLALKGAALAARVYPQPWLRPSSDVDLLIRPGDVTRATETLVAAGWRIFIPKAENPLDFGHDTSFVDSRRTLLELHHKAAWHFQARFDPEALFRRSVPQSLESGEVRVLSPEDNLIHLCVHAGSHFFDGVKWLFDLKLAVLRGDLDWNAIPRLAREAHVASVTGMALTEARDRVGAPIPAEALRSLPPGSARLAATRLCRNIPTDMVRIRSAAYDLMLADGLSREWVMRLTSFPIKRATRAAKHVSRLASGLLNGHR